jgi:hypothetical protein
MSSHAPREVACLALVVALAAACSSDPVAPPTRKGEGEACAASTECSGALLCIDGTCQGGGCSQASQCSGTPSATCAVWACVASRCVPGCSTATDAGSADASAPSDAGSARDASAVEDARVPMDATVAPDAELAQDLGPSLDAEVFADATAVDADGVAEDVPSAPDAQVASDAAPAIDGGALADAGAPACVTTPRAPMAGDLVINELLADPAAGAAGDANGDGTRDGTADEFVELVNVSGQVLDLAGVVVADATAVRYTFGARTLGCGGVVVVFGGGNSAAPTWSPDWVAASGGLSLNNTGDTVRVGTAASPASVASVTYGADGDMDQSLVRQPEALASSPLVLHGAAAGAGGRVFSPGRRVDGAAF